MAGRLGDVNQGDLLAEEPKGTVAGKLPGHGPEGAGRSQSAQSSDEGPQWAWSEGAQEGGDVTDQPKPLPDAVPGKGAKPAGEIRARWAWVEAEVWTERMLTALEQGVLGGKWFSLMDKVYALPNLRRAFERVKANGGAAGADQVTVEEFEPHREANLEKLAQSLRDGTYRPQAIRRAWIPKPGSKEKRPLGIPTVRDRVVQAALRAVLEPIFERDFAAQSYGFRPERGCKDALRRVDALLKQGYDWVVDADLKSYFDTIPHSSLMERVREKVAEGRVLRWLEAFLHARVLETAKSWTPTGGTPQGAVVSPLRSNIYLDSLDHLMEGKGIEMVRYADDFVVLCRSEGAAQEALEVVRDWTAAAGLIRHPVKTRIMDATQEGGFDFRGYRFAAGQRWPRRKSLDKLSDTIRAKTRRVSGQNLQAIITDLNRTLRGWFEYFQHSHRFTFLALDKGVRMRLRSILRLRQGRQGRGRGSDHQRWPNVFFTRQGLFSLTEAHRLACQSSRR